MFRLVTLRIRLAFVFIASLASLSAFVVSLSHTTGARPNELKSPNQNNKDTDRSQCAELESRVYLLNTELSQAQNGLVC